MHPHDYESRDGLELAWLLERGEVSPQELMACAIAQAESRGAALNALCYTRYQAALEEAAVATRKGRFGALPFLLKDSGLGAKTLPSSIGSRLFAGMTSCVESTLNTRFMADGFLSFGRTTVPEFCMAPTTEAVVYGGPTRNPWDRSRSSGGSSGGAAAAVAAGIVPIAHGSDGGGSIRIPASCCGVFGLKPSRGLVPHGPLRGEGWGGLAVDGVLSLTVRDTAAAIDGIAGMEIGQPYAAPARPDSYLAMLGKPFTRPLRIARWIRAFEDIEIAAECVQAVDRGERLLQDLGHEVIAVEPPEIKYSSFITAITDVMATNVVASVNGFLRTRLPLDLSEHLEPAILDAYEIGQRITAETYALAITRFHGIARQLETHMAKFDFVLTPTLTQLPLPLGTLTMQEDFRPFRARAGRYTTFLAIVNASGQPAASLPLYWTSNSLPVGVQLIGRFGQDADLLRLCAALEASSPWRYRRPPVAP
jgi:amidase